MATEPGIEQGCAVTAGKASRCRQDCAYRRHLDACPEEECEACRRLLPACRVPPRDADFRDGRYVGERYVCDECDAAAAAGVKS